MDSEKQIGIEELKKHLDNRWWRLNNLYYITDKSGNKILFNPENWVAQKELYDGMWFMNIIPKARQLGVCLGPDTRVLKADLKWEKISQLKPGTEIISVDEYPKEKGRGQARKMRTGVVEGVVEVYREAYRVTFDDGRTVICTGQHPWLSKKTNTQWEWRSIEKKKDPKTGKYKKNAHNSVLKVGTYIRSITKPWDNERTYDDGWVGGIIDGEGSFSNKKRLGAQACLAQRDNNILSEIKKYCEKNNYTYRVEVDKRKSGDKSKLGNDPVYKIVVGRMNELFRFIGKTRPYRFITRRWWEGKETPIYDSCAQIVKIEKLGKRKLIDLQTSEGTYIAEGLVSHNTTFWTIFYLDQILFSDNKTAGIIAHTYNDMKRIFKHKIKYAWNNLHPWLKNAIGEPNTDNAYELSFPNGSSIFVSMSTRGGTLNFLHISEFGKICAKYPDKAEEIVTGAINSVDVGQFISIESTAEGKEGYFYDFCMEADRRQREGRQLTPLDFKLFFFPWYIEPRYTLDGDVRIDQETKDYFSSLSAKMRVEFTEGQMKWYQKKKELNKGKITQEYPSHLDEAFSASVEGAYYANEMTKVYNQNRIRPVPHDRDLDVDTWWDLGMDDFNVVLFSQTKGGEIRFIDMYWNHGENLEHYFNILKEKRDELGYRYGRHYLPWDVEVKELQSGLTRRQHLSNLGLVPITVGKKTAILDGINNVRRLFNRFVFDETKCKRLHESLFNYRKDFDHKMGKWKDKPRHDENSHFADAVRLMANEWREPMQTGYFSGSYKEVDQAFFG